MNSAELMAAAGLMLADLDEARAMYEANRPEGSPEFSEAVLPHLKSCRPDKKWEDILRERELAALASRKALDPAMPVYGPNRFTVSDDCQHIMDEHCARALESYNAAGLEPGATAVFERLSRLVAMLNLVPVHHEPNSAEFLWARLRVVFSGAGWMGWKTIVPIVAGQYPNCPWLADETEDAWRDNLREAHGHCGWPVQLTHLRWRNACAAVSTNDDATPWHKVVAMMHALKHIRYDAAAHTLVVLFNSTATRIQLTPGTNVIENFVLGRVTKALGSSAKAGDAINAALASILSRINVQHFLPLRSLATLPPDVLCGPWSTLTPDPANDEFFQFGLAMDGVWLAREGTIRVERHDAQLISEYNWNIVDPTNYDDKRADFERALPKTYAPTFPADYFIAAFPNMVLNHFEPEVLDAAATLFDTPLIANLLRPWVPELRNEFPLVAFLPSSATQAHSTNQGKTMAAETYGRVTVPGIEAEKIKEGDSAPDSRAAMNSVQRYGTAVLDEFYMPDNKSHILCRDNIQSLCVGKAILAGKVYENTGSVRLRYSMTISAKALQVAPDIINRSMFWFLDNLTEEARANAAAVDAIQSGKLSLQMRLGAWAIVEKYGVADELRTALKASSPGWRFGCHRALAIILYRIRQAVLPDGEASPLGASEAIDRALAQMRDRHHQHTMDADDAGLLTMLAEGKDCTLSLRAVFDGMGFADVQHIADWMNEHGESGMGGMRWSNPKSLLEGRLHVAGLTGRPLAALLPALTGKTLLSSDRMVAQLMAEEIRRMIPCGTSWVLPEHLGLAGWQLHRGQDHGSGIRCCLRQVKE